MSDKPILLIAYDFHPFVGGGGAIRMIKLAKYFRQAGREVHVLAGGFESQCSDPSYGDELVGVHLHIANSTPVSIQSGGSGSQPELLRLAGRAIRTILPFPDNRFRFLPSMFRKASELIRQLEPQAVVVTIPPNSMGVLIPMLRKRFPQLNLVLDVRDMWALDPLLTPDTKWFRFTQRLVEAWSVAKADHIVSVTEGYRDWFARQLKRTSRLSVIHNGYDEADFAFQQGEPPKNLIRVGYAGSLGGINGPRTIRYIMKAISTYLEKHPEMRSSLRFCFIGHVGEEERKFVEEHNLGNQVELPGFMSHSDCLKHLTCCHALLINHFALPNCDIIYPGKLFEYLRLGRPMLVCSPPGILPDFVSKRNLGEIAPFDDSIEIEAALTRLLHGLRLPKSPYSIDPMGYKDFERSEQAKRYLRLLDSISTSDHGNCQ